MNIFFLDLNHKKNVQYYHNKHCIKIILEIAQMLYTAHWMTTPDYKLPKKNELPSTLVVEPEWISRHRRMTGLKVYRKTHFNHPTSRWIRQSQSNYSYACNLGLELCREYTRRYNKTHKTEERLVYLLDNPPKFFNTDDIPAYLATENIPEGCTPVPLAMPDKYHCSNLIHAYRMYYIHEKKHISHSEEHYDRMCEDWRMR
jgi:hypothetical protein